MPGDFPAPDSYSIPADPIKAVGAILGHFQGASLDVFLSGLTEAVNVMRTYGIPIFLLSPAIRNSTKTVVPDSPPPAVLDLAPSDVRDDSAPRRWKSGPISAMERERILDMDAYGNSAEAISAEIGRSESVVSKVINKYTGKGNSEQLNAFEEENSNDD